MPVGAPGYLPAQGFAVLLEFDDPTEAEHIFAAHFGVHTDRFGTPWEINCGRVIAETEK